MASIQQYSQSFSAWAFRLGALLCLLLAPASQAQLNVSVASFGARADGILRTDGAMNAGSSILTSASASFTSPDIGKYIQVIGAGPGGSCRGGASMAQGSTAFTASSGSFNSADVGRGIIVIGAGVGGGNLVTSIAAVSSYSSVALKVAAQTGVGGASYCYGAMTLEGTIQSVLSPTSVMLSASAAATITGATYSYGTDNHAAFQTALDTAGQAGGGTVSIPQPTSCPGGAVCGYVVSTTDQMTAHAPGAVKIRYNNVSLIGGTPQINLFCRGAWATYYNSAKFPGQTATIRGNCIAVGDDGGPRGIAGEYMSNVTISNLHLYGMTNGNTQSVSYSPTDPPLTTTGDGWDETHKAIYLWENASESNIIIDSVYIQDFKGENIYSGGSVMTGIVIRNSTMTNFNGDGISMLAADLQVINNTITNGSNAGIENSSKSNTSAALVRQLYQGNTIGNMPREALVVVGVDSGVATGSIQILNNYFDNIAQTNRSGAQTAIYLAAQWGENDVAPSNVTISGNTCHDCFSFANLQTSGTTLVSNNTFIVDQMNADAFLYFTFPMTNLTVANNIGYRTAAAASAGRTLGAVYMLNPGYATGNFAWNNVLVQNNSWDLPGTPNYAFVITSGPGWSLVTAKNVIWQNETCNGCTYADINHGVFNLAASTTIIPYGPVIYVNGNSSPVTATLDASKELDGSQVKVINSGTSSVNFNSDRNLSLSSPLTLNPGASAIFRFNGGTGTYSVGSSTPTVGVTLTPPTVSLFAGQSAQLSASVSGSTNQQVSWSLSPAGSGAVSATGLYNAPASISLQQNVTVTATSAADPTKSGTATVTLNPAVSVSVNPPAATLTANQSQQLTATVTGSTNQQVTWSVSPAGAGSVSAAGLYTAPVSIPVQQSVIVTATSLADSTKSAAAIITLNPSVAVSVTPQSATLSVSQTLQLTATVTGASNQQVTWSLSGAGALSAAGLYTAPSTLAVQQAVTATATSVADTTRSASSTITLVPVTVSINVPSASLGGAQALQFSATVAGTSNQSVIWSILPAGAGTISAAGLYTAPAVVAAQQAVTVKATSAADPAKSATATVTLSPVTISINPLSASLLAAQTAQFTPTLTWTSNQLVNWSISPAGAGSITGAGLYTAPATIGAQQTVTVTATSLADATKIASASVTLLVPGSIPASGYAYQRTVTIAHNQVVAADQSNFPVLIKGVYPFLANTAAGGHVQSAGGYDIVFSSDSAAVNRLNWEVESYDPSSGAIAVWIRIPALSSTADTVLYMSYGNPAIASSQSSKNATWDSSFAAVYHLNESAASVSVGDATSNSNGGAAQANTNLNSAAGIAGAGLRFNGSSDYVNSGKPPSLSIVGPVTLEGWVNLASWPRNGYGGFMAAKGQQYFMEFTTDNSGTHGIVAGTYQNANMFTGTALVVNSAFTGAYHHVASTWDGTRWSLYLDGVLAAQSVSPQGPALSTEAFTIGGQTFSGGYPFQYLNGVVDEVRVSSTPRSAGWIATEYHNQSQPSTFYSLGAEQGGSAGAPVVSVAVNPPTGSITAGQTVQFSATVSGSTNQQVTWSLSGAGAVSPSGLYTAPASVSSTQVATVTATSAADPTKSASAAITVSPASATIAIAVNPPSGSIAAGQTLQFSASVSGTTNQQVTWSLSGAGTVSPSGLYTAPASVSAQQTVTVTATSAADPTKSASAIVTVAPAAAAPVACSAPATNANTGCYYQDTSFGTLGLTRVDPYVQFNWPAGVAIAPGVGPQNFSVRWQGYHTFQYSWYNLYLTVDDTARVYLDGNLIFDTATSTGTSPYKIPFLPSSGSHLVTVEYVHRTGAANISVAWGTAQ